MKLRLILWFKFTNNVYSVFCKTIICHMQIVTVISYFNGFCLGANQNFNVENLKVFGNSFFNFMIGFRRSDTPVL